MNKPSLKKTVGIVAGIAVALLVYFIPIEGLPYEGRKCLALSLCAVIWWATSAMHSGYTSASLLGAYALVMDPGVVPPSSIFGMWMSPIMYMVIGGFLIAYAVQESGLGRRVSFHFVYRFVGSYRSVIVSCYVLGFLLSFLIPHPWPRSFLLMSVMLYVIGVAKLDRAHAGNIGLAVFAGSVPTSTILLTADSAMNNLVGQLAGVDMKFFTWLLYMGLPGVVASVATCAGQLLLFRAPAEFHLDKAEIHSQLAGLGLWTRREKWVCAVLAVAIVFWMTDALTGIHPGWIALFAAIALALPFVGILDAASWRQVNVATLLFLCAALSIGTVGGATGMNDWLANTLMPSGGGGSIATFMAVSAVVCVIIHMFLGSIMAVMSICVPAIVAYAQGMGIPPLAAALTAFCVLTLHWLLPFHHMNLLVGLGEDGGGYTNGQVLRLGLWQFVVVAVTLTVAAFWWKAVGLL